MVMTMNQDDGIIKRDVHKGICLVDNFGCLTIEYYDDDGMLVLAESDGTGMSDKEVEDIYNNCINIDGYLETLINYKKG
jgi:hypothetical protein